MQRKTPAGRANGELREGKSEDSEHPKVPLSIPRTPERIAALNLGNKFGKDGVVRGSVLPKDMQQGFVSYCVAMSTLMLFIAWPYIYFSLLIASLFNRTALLVLILCWSTLLLPARLLWHDCTRSYILNTWQEFFNFSWILEETLPTDRNFCFAEFPHGAFPFGPILAAGPVAVVFPGHQVYGLAASAVFYLPFYKHFMTWIGCKPASRKNLAQLLQRGSVAVVMGGIAEMFMLKDDREEVMLRTRKGLMRTAIETGTAVVPTYFMGNSRVLKFGPQFLKTVSRKLRTSLGFVFGRLGLPVPIQHPITMVVGKAIQPEVLALKPDDDGYEEEMQAACARLSERLATDLLALYERHRHVVGWEDRSLIIH